jgi:uncharacterized membrane protein YfcA
MPDLQWWQWALGAVCAFFVGVAKTGVPGLGILVVPLMVFAVGDARQSAGWLLPVLCLADLFAVVIWRRKAAAGRLFSLAPWVLIGMGAGAVALGAPERYLRLLVAFIVLLMLWAYLRRRLRPDTSSAAHPVPYGVSAGFATTVANAAGPVMNLYLLSKDLPKEEFIATGAWFFFLINLSKVPIYAWHGLFSRASLLFDLTLAPAVVVGALTGQWIFRRLNQKAFEATVLILTAISALLLFR